MAKSIIIAYLMWFFGGFFGLHHLYLRRYKQAFIWWCFPGGYFGAGWIRDSWRIPEYVRDANDNPEYLKNLSQQMLQHKKPPMRIVRFLGEYVVGNMFGILCLIAAPEKEDELGPGVDLNSISSLLAPFGTALGIWLVGNIGREKGDLKWPLIGCYLMAPFYIYNKVGYSWLTLSGVLIFNWKAKSWRRNITRPKSFTKAAPLLFFCCVLYSSIWMSYFFFNFRITTNEGDVIKLRDAVNNLIRSPAFQEFANNASKLWQHLLKEGFYSALSQLIDSLDPLGEKHSLRILNLDKGVSPEELKARCRQLYLEWHPDKIQDPDKKAEGNNRFVEIKTACEQLKSIKQHRQVRRDQIEL